MSNILYKQNLDDNLRLLAAQRQSYNEAKFYRSSYRILVFVPFLISFLVINSYIDATDQYSVIRFLIDLLVLLVGGFLMNKSSLYQVLGANIQQKFDTNIFGLPFEWKIKQDITEIERLYCKHKKDENIERLRNWYNDEIQNLAYPKDVLAAQKQNLFWTDSVRKDYIFFNVLIFISLLFFIGLSIFMFITYSEYPLWKKVYEIFVILLSLYFFLGENILSNYKTIRLLNNANNKFSSLQKHIVDSDDINCSNRMLGDIQEEIFVYRKHGVSVPNYYDRMRKFKLESSSRRMIKDLFN
ncbi:S-4TM family putative pore-forming effector [Acinetobacter indicus]|uniref:S-4TM family putative pore-forming effector n=1 Tax=Acinetobacter indicus TaxID=756892 RepID=UPI0009491CBC|nr:S-4TM family putative pore-forming effector [Acinetobacter indicus]